MFRFSAIFIFIICFISVQGQNPTQVDTIEIFSAKMNKTAKAVVIFPDNYRNDTGEKYPVVYLLHGYSDNYSTYINKIPAIKRIVNDYQFIVVCPDGGYSSWYLDSPVDKNYQYETYISKEVVEYIDKNYRTLASTKGRAITGHSMGGHGALYIALRHLETFGAAGSMSGGVDLNYKPKGWHIQKRLGNYETHPERWHENSVINLIDSIKNKNFPLIIDCGIDDFFFGINIDLHKKLVKEKIPHDFITRPGKHSWNYWQNAIEYQMMFFYFYFQKNEPK